jgi:hypothetical protein
MKPALVQHELAEVSVETIDGVTLEVRRTDDPGRAKRLARLLADLLATPAPEHREDR